MQFQLQGRLVHVENERLFNISNMISIKSANGTDFWSNLGALNFAAAFDTIVDWISSIGDWIWDNLLWAAIGTVAIIVIVIVALLVIAMVLRCLLNVHPAGRVLNLFDSAAGQKKFI